VCTCSGLIECSTVDTARDRPSLAAACTGSSAARPASAAACATAGVGSGDRVLTQVAWACVHCVPVLWFVVCVSQASCTSKPNQEPKACEGESQGARAPRGRHPVAQERGLASHACIALGRLRGVGFRLRSEMWLARAGVRASATEATSCKCQDAQFGVIQQTGSAARPDSAHPAVKAAQHECGHA
jgi:hypothetical protein